MAKNAAPLACLSVFFYRVAFLAQAAFLYNGFLEGKSLALNGAALVEPSGALRLTNNSQNVTGHAFYPVALQMFDKRSPSYPNASSFSTTFVFAIDPSIPGHSGHGLAFALAPSIKFEGAESGGFFGLCNRSNNGNQSNHIVAVQFETGKVTNSKRNRIGININSMFSVLSKPPFTSFYIDDAIPKEIQLDSGDPIAVWIEYDGLSRTLNVTIGLLEAKPEQPLISHPVDLTPILNNQTFVGFAASTGIKTSCHYILGWSFAMNASARQLRYTLLPKGPNKQRPSSSNNPRWKLLGVLSVAAILKIVFLTFLFRRMRKTESLEDWERDCPHRFNYKDLYTATNGFKDSEQIGIGGFGSVYKGLLLSTGGEIAVKRVKQNSSQGIKEFAAEIESLGRLRHKNLVNLQGWCKKNNDLLIVYDYIPNGSLHSFLYTPKHNMVLNWEQRLNILKGIAAGLLYLHEDWEQVVIHRDVKPSNVLIDADMNARLSDFGLSRQYDHKEVSHTTRVVGTIGYIPPELFRTGKASTSTDVYAYGVLLLEVGCGRKPLGSDQFILVDWVMEWYEKGEILHVADPKLGSNYKVEEMEVVLQLGLLCMHCKPEARPSMRQVMRFLDGECPLPGIHAGVSTQRSTSTDCSSSLSIASISFASINEGR